MSSLGGRSALQEGSAIKSRVQWCQHRRPTLDVDIAAVSVRGAEAAQRGAVVAPMPQRAALVAAGLAKVSEGEALVELPGLWPNAASEHMFYGAPCKRAAALRDGAYDRRQEGRRGQGESVASRL